MGLPIAVEKLSPKQESVLFLHVAQRNVREIAETTGLSESYVHGLIKSEAGQKFLEPLRKRVREQISASLVNDLTDLGSLALAAIRRTLEADISPMHKAKPNQDKVALAILKGVGVLQEEEGQRSPAPQLPAELTQALIDALERSNEVRRIHDITEVAAEVVE